MTDLRIPDLGDYITVRYESVYSDDEQVCRGVVHRVDSTIWDPDDPLNRENIDAASHDIYIWPEEEPDRGDHPVYREVATRKLTLIMWDNEFDHGTFYGKNGGRWNRLSRGNPKWETGVNA